MKKACTTCGIEKGPLDFHKKVAMDQVERRAECRACANKRQVVKRAVLRAEVLKAYGGMCACCKEKELVFLAFDHVNHDGHEHRRQLGDRSSTTLVRWIKKNAYPKDIIQVLCFNCNEARRYGVCPHQLAAAAPKES